MIRVGTVSLGNKRAGSSYKPELGDVVVNIDRPNTLGNPFEKKDGLSRDDCIALYRELLEREMRLRRGHRYLAVLHIVEKVIEGHDVMLMCWCHPLSCHGQVIKEAVEKLL